METKGEVRLSDSSGRNISHMGLESIERIFRALGQIIAEREGVVVTYNGMKKREDEPVQTA